MAEVYLDGKFLGTVDDAASFVDDFRDQRRNGSIAEQASVYHDKKFNEVRIYAQEGRAQRPLIIVREGKSLLTKKHLEQLEANEISWQDLVRQGVIEYVDAAEEENLFVAYEEESLTPEHTHLEITKGSICGVTTSLVPFGNYNQSARLIIGSKNQKQAIGFYAANYHIRMDMDTNILHYPQYPVVRTKIHDVSNYAEHPAGQNMVVAIMTYSGYNMEDAIVLNQSSIDLGLGRYGRILRLVRGCMFWWLEVLMCSFGEN